MLDSRKTLLVVTATLFTAWLAVQFSRLTGDETGMIRFVLGTVFSLAILLRPKPARDNDLALAAAPAADSRARRAAAMAALAGALLVVAGIVLHIHQAEWLGLLLLVYAALRWTLPPTYSRDIALCLALFYWVHPLPSQAVGKLQLALQYLSVHGAEWLLQCANVRVWADGMVLRTTTTPVGVPESCSGLKTGITVLMSCAGVGILLRFRRLHILGLAAAGLVQVAALNVLRVAAAAYFAPRMPREWADTFLHDTLGTFLIGTVVLVQVEAAMLRARLTRRKSAEPQAARTGATRVLLPKWLLAVPAVLLFLALVAGLVYKSRPYHRSEMIHGVVDELSETDLENSQRAANVALALNPENLELRSTLVRILLLQRKYNEALAELEKIPEADRGIYQVVLKAVALSRTGHLREAIALIDSLSEGDRALPGIAILKAEFEASADDPAAVSENIVKATGMLSLIPRVRALFPYLAIREQWKTIVACHVPLPYTDATQAFIAVAAHARENHTYISGKILKEIAAQWPDDPRLLNYLLAFAVLHPNTDWENLFASILTRNLPRLNAEQISAYLGHAAWLKRDDLVALACRNLKKLDPTDPSLYFVPAFSAPEGSEERRADSARCLAELERRQKAGTATRRMQMLYPAVLALAGKYDEAILKLDELGGTYPNDEANLLYRRIAFFRMKGDWQGAYEAARTYHETTGANHLIPVVTQIEAISRMGMGTYALTLARAAMDFFPGSEHAAFTLAALLDAYGYKEEALLAIPANVPGTNHFAAVAALLADTGRTVEAARFAQAAGPKAEAPSPELSLPPPQPLVLPAAEFVLLPWSLPALPDADIDGVCRRLDSEAAAAASPYFAAIKRLLAQWLRQKGGGNSSDPAAWAAAGRDKLEQAMALNELALLLAARQEFDRAESALARATDLYPGAPDVWRMRVAFSRGKPDVLARALALCPTDPEIWLASIVASNKTDRTGEWALSSAEKAVAAGKTPVGTMVRAGDFLWRSGKIGAATVCARDAVKRARGLVPAYVLGIRCALSQKDLQWALSCAQAAIENAVDPSPFHKVLVNVKTLLDNADADFMTSLEKLHARYPDAAEWGRRLAAAYLLKGQMREFSSILSDLSETKDAQAQVSSLMLQSELERVQGNLDKAIALLEEAHAKAPENATILNNLIYSLAQRPETLARARELLPGLLAVNVESFTKYDTAALVYLRGGNLEEAQKCADKAMSLVNKDDYAWAEVYLNAAELDLKRGLPKQATEKIKAVYKQSRQPEFVEKRAWELLVNAERGTRSAERRTGQ